MADLYWHKDDENLTYGYFGITLSNTSDGTNGFLYDPTTTWLTKLNWSGQPGIHFTCKSGLVLPANCRNLFAYAKSYFPSSWSNIANFTTIDTSEVENMSYMFHKADLRFLDFSNFNTSNCTNMASMFESAYHDVSIKVGYDRATDLTSFDLSKVGITYRMFESFGGSAPLGINGGDVSNIDQLHYMFYGANVGSCYDGDQGSKLEHNGIYVGENIDGSRDIKPTADTSYMFVGASGYNGARAKRAKAPYMINCANTGPSGVFGGNKAEFGDPYEVYLYDSEFTHYNMFEKREDNGESVSPYIKKVLE